MHVTTSRGSGAGTRAVSLGSVRLLAFLAWLAGGELAFAKTIITRFCDPWRDSQSSTRIECDCEEGIWNIRFALKTVEGHESGGDKNSSAGDPSEQGKSPSSGVVMAFSKDAESPLYCLEFSKLEGDSQPRWDAQIRRRDGRVEERWKIEGVAVWKEGQDPAMQVLRVQVPLHVLNPVYGKSVECKDSIRVALLRRTVVQNRPVWSSWQYLADQEGSPWCPSAFGTLPVDSETDQDFALPEEPRTSKTFRLAANQMRAEFRRYLDDSKLQERTVDWYDQLGQFPEVNPKWLVLDAAGPSHSSSSSHRLPKDGWIGLPFSLHARFAEEGAPQRAWKIELTREDRSAGGWVMEWLGQGRSGVVRWKNPSGAAGKTVVREAIVLFSPTTHPNREPRDVVMTYRGTGDLVDLEVYLDGARAAVSVLKSPAPWEFTNGVQGAWESQADWKLSLSGSTIESLQVYRAFLTPIEALGLIPDVPFVSWSEWRPENRRLWIEHFAEREDRDGGYLLESLLHYSESAKRAAKGENASNSKIDNHK